MTSVFGFKARVDLSYDYRPQHTILGSPLVLHLHNITESKPAGSLVPTLPQDRPRKPNFIPSFYFTTPRVNTSIMSRRILWSHYNNNTVIAIRPRARSKRSYPPSAFCLPLSPMLDCRGVLKGLSPAPFQAFSIDLIGKTHSG